MGREVLTHFSLLQCYSVPLKEGDVIIAGTDGVWDNLFDPECAALVSQTQGKGQNPAQSAEALARCAHMRCASALSKALHPAHASGPLHPSRMLIKWQRVV